MSYNNFLQTKDTVYVPEYHVIKLVSDEAN